MVKMKKDITSLLVSIVVSAILCCENVANANEPNIVGWYTLDENSGDIAHDYSDYGHDGILVGATWAPTKGKLGGAVSFDESGRNRIIIPIGGIAPRAGTFAFWAYLSKPQSNNGYLLGHTLSPISRIDRIQIYLSNKTTETAELCLGLGDSHTRHMEIATIDADIWFHMALTWDGSTYTVYVNGLQKATGTYMGLNALSNVLHIGNSGRDQRNEGFYGSIDEVIIFNCILDAAEIAQLYREEGMAFMRDPLLQRLIAAGNQAETMINEHKLPAAITLLKDMIAESEKRKESQIDKTKSREPLLFSDLYILLAEAERLNGASVQDISTLYKKSLLLPLRWSNYVPVFLWFFENMPEKQYTTIIQDCVRNNNISLQNIPYMANRFEAIGNWKAFNLFIEAVFLQVNTKVDYAQAIRNGLRNEKWIKNFWQHCRSNPELEEYIIEECCRLAQSKINKSEIFDPNEIYKAIANKYCTDYAKFVCEFYSCENKFRKAQYENTISEVNDFIKSNKFVPKVLAIKALLLKGESYLCLGNTKKAIDAFSEAIIQFPESKEIANVYYHIGYCEMLEGKFEEAKKAFDVVIQKYPECNYASKAQTYLDRIENIKN